LHSFAKLLGMGLLGWGKKDNNSEEVAVVSQLPANLQDETTRFKVIIDSIEEGVILIDDQQIVRLINPGASALCGWKPEEATNLAADSVVQLINEKGAVNGRKQPGHSRSGRPERYK
jgi:PAS domain-containing protein